MAPSSNSSDEELLERMAAGDQQALSSLYDRYRSVVFSLALRILKGGLSHSEIATKLGEPLGTVKSRSRLALLALRESRGAQFER